MNKQLVRLISTKHTVLFQRWTVCLYIMDKLEMQTLHAPHQMDGFFPSAKRFMSFPLLDSNKDFKIAPTTTIFEFSSASLLEILAFWLMLPPTCVNDRLNLIWTNEFVILLCSDFFYHSLSFANLRIYAIYSMIFSIFQVIFAFLVRQYTYPD